MTDSSPYGPRLERLGAMIDARDAAAPPPAPPRCPIEPDLDVLRASRSEQWRQAIPSRFVWASVDDFADPGRPAFFMPDVAGELQAWGSPDCAGSLVLVGPVGTCKTHAAIAAARLKFDRGFDVVFQPVVELLNDLRPGGPEGRLDELSWCDVLILDDIGSEKASEWTAEQLYAIVNRRWLEGLPTVVTSNLPPREMERSAGARVFSRLIGSGARLVAMEGADRRLTRR